MPRQARSGRAHRAESARTSQRFHEAIERLEFRRLLTATIVGNPTVFPTIQAAVDAAPDGATINVTAGNYAETVSIFKKLTIKGAQAGIDGRSNARGVSESIVTGADAGGGIFTTAFRIGASDVVLDGFTVEGITSQSDTQGAGITMLPNIAGTKIINNIVQNNPSGLYLSNNSSTKPAIIQFNYFAFNNLNGPSSGQAIHSNGSISGGVLTNVIIDNNFFFKNFGGAPPVSTGLEPAIGLQASPISQQTNITITNNAFDSNGKAMLFYNSNGVLIENNVIQYCRDTTSGGLRFEGGAKNFTIRNNQMYGSDARAIRIDNKAWEVENEGFVITGNNIWRNGLEDGAQFAGLYVNGGQYSGRLDAENNWWGSATGPGGDGAATGGTGDGVFANGEDVDWSPFATTPFPGQQRPYRGAAWDATSIIPIVDFDHGGEGIGYHDNTFENIPNRLHPLESVDIQASTDVNTTGYNLAYTRAGEWLEFTINVPANGTYTLEARVANAQTTPGTFHLEVDGSTVLATTNALNTGSQTIWQNMTKAGINLPSGVHVLRIVFDANGNGGGIGNWNWFRFIPTGVTPPPAVPTNLGATAPTSSSVNLTWSDNSNNETGFRVERKTGVAGAWQLLTTTAANATSYQDNTVAATTQYFYRVRSTGAGGDSGSSNEAGVTTPAAGVTYLSDLTWVSATNGWGPVEKDMGVGGSGANDGPPITLNGVVYTKGLGAHAVSEIIYNLGGNYGSFISDVGVDDRQTSGSSVQFQVFVDNVKLFDSGTMGATSATQTVNVNLTGAQQLKLVVLDGGDGVSFDHADWAGARLLAAAQPPAVPAAPTTLVATAAGTTQINLTWADNASNETGFIVERSLNGSTGWTQVGTPAANATSFSNTGLSPSTQYFYRVRATNSGTDSTNSNTANATTQATPTAPAAPTNLAATAFSSSQINLTWTDNANNETGFILERSPDGVNNWTQVATPAQNATSASDTTVLASTQYFYRIRATNGVGPSTDSNVVNATTPAAPSVPATPSNLAATAVSATQINLTWTDNANNETGFIVERSLNGTTGWTQVGTPATNATSFNNNTGLSAGTQYFYRVRATNGVGPSGNSNVANATTFNSSAATFIPTGATWKYLDNGSNQGTAWRATAFNDSTWASGAAQLGYGDGDEATVVSFGGSSSNKFVTTYFRKSFTVSDASVVTALSLRLLRDDGAVVYLNGTEVYRNNMPIGTISNTTFASSVTEDSTFFTSSISPALLVSGTNVVAVEIHQSDAGSSDVSFNFELTATVSQPSIPPAAPGNLVATANGTNRIDLTWADNANNESGFKIERSLDGVNSWTQIATPAANATSYSDQTGLSQGTQYFYRIRATNAVGDSGNSKVADATTAIPQPPAAPTNLVATPAGTNQINLTWTDNANNETGFVVERSLDGSTGWTQIATPAANAVSYNNTTGLSPGTQYFYRVRATNGVGPSGDSNIDDATTAVPTAPAAPSNLAATAASQTQINLTWTDNANNETGFIVERSLNGVNGWTQIATPAANATSFSNNSGLSPSTQYFYRVRATNGVGPSNNSNVASATTPAASAFTDRDLGNVGIAGSSSLVSGTYSVKGGGDDLVGANDAGHLVYQQLTGNGEIIARVTAVQNTSSGAQAGVMMRETLNSNSKSVSMVIQRNGQAMAIRRTTTNGSAVTTSASSSAAPFWVRIVRNGSTFTMYRSSNGSTWTQVNSTSITMSNTIFVGLIVCSRVVGTLNTSTFTNVQVIQAVPRAAATSVSMSTSSLLTDTASKTDASTLVDSV